MSFSPKSLMGHLLCDAQTNSCENVIFKFYAIYSITQVKLWSSQLRTDKFCNCVYDHFIYNFFRTISLLTLSQLSKILAFFNVVSRFVGTLQTLHYFSEIPGKSVQRKNVQNLSVPWKFEYSRIQPTFLPNRYLPKLFVVCPWQLSEQSSSGFFIAAKFLLNGSDHSHIKLFHEIPSSHNINTSY